MALLFSCAPGLILSTVVGTAPYHEVGAPSLSETVRLECARSLEKLDRWEWLLACLPDSGGHLSLWRERRRVQLASCSGDVPRARSLLLASLEESTQGFRAADLEVVPSAQDDEGWDRFAKGEASFQSWLSLARLEEADGDHAAATSALGSARELARLLDASPYSYGRPRSERVERQAGGLIERMHGPAAALAHVESALQHLSADLEPSAEGDEGSMLGLLSLHAELLERMGRTDEASAVWARIGRAQRVHYRAQ